MTNRQWLLGTSEYDILLKANERLKKAWNGNSPVCMLDVLSKEERDCREFNDCEKCIQAWLNEERK